MKTTNERILEILNFIQDTGTTSKEKYDFVKNALKEQDKITRHSCADEIQNISACGCNIWDGEKVYVADVINSIICTPEFLGDKNKVRNLLTPEEKEYLKTNAGKYLFRTVFPNMEKAARRALRLSMLNEPITYLRWLDNIQSVKALLSLRLNELKCDPSDCGRS